MTQEVKKILDEEENYIKSLYVKGKISENEKNFTAFGFALCLMRMNMIMQEESEQFISSVMNFY